MGVNTNYKTATTTTTNKQQQQQQQQQQQPQPWKCLIPCKHTKDVLSQLHVGNRLLLSVPEEFMVVCRPIGVSLGLRCYNVCDIYIWLPLHMRSCHVPSPGQPCQW